MDDGSSCGTSAGRSKPDASRISVSVSVILVSVFALV